MSKLQFKKEVDKYLSFLYFFKGAFLGGILIFLVGTIIAAWVVPHNGELLAYIYLSQYFLCGGAFCYIKHEINKIEKGKE